MNAQYDVIVAGGGPAGVAAAIAAAECGANTLLVESAGCLGGTGTSGAVSHWLGGRTPDCREFTAGGIFRRLTEQAVAEGIALLPTPCKGFSPYGWTVDSHLTAGIPFNRFLMAEMLDRVVTGSGARILFDTRVTGVELGDSSIRTLTVHNKSGFTTLSARNFIDATGDADLAALAGCPFQLGREKDCLTAPASLEFHVSGVDSEILKQYIDSTGSNRFLKEIADLRKRGIWRFKFDRLIMVQMCHSDEFLVNTPRLTGVDGTNGESVSDAYVEGRRMIVELFAILKQYFPGFANARISGIASAMGIRESRRIKGDFTLTVDDLLAGREFEDCIGFACYGWDLPDPERPSYQIMHEKNVRTPDVIPLPFRIMVPQAMDNLLVAGRSVSVEREVLGAIRVMAPCMVMGEAAGVASAAGRSVHELRKRLSARGCSPERSPCCPFRN